MLITENGIQPIIFAILSMIIIYASSGSTISRSYIDKTDIFLYKKKGGTCMVAN